MRRTIARRLRLALPLLIIVLGVALLPTRTWAHPLGNFTVNQYSRLDVGASQVQALYIVDMAEIPTFQERSKIDTDHDDVISAVEQAQYVAQQSSVFRNNLHLTINGAELAWEPQTQTMEFLDGQGGLKTMRFTLHMVAAMPKATAPIQAAYRDDNYSERIGWREIIVRADNTAQLVNSSAPATDMSNELRNYPQDLLQSPLNLSNATFTFQPGGNGQGATTPIQGATIVDPSSTRQQDEQFAALINRQNLGTSALLLVLLTAFGLGGLHALAPGHGKTIVAAYLVGARGTAKHAVFLGLTTTITHTAGVFLLGLITLSISHWILPEQFYPWLGVVSGALVVVIGVSLVSGRLRQWRKRSASGDMGLPGGHDHDASSWLDHEHGPDTHTHLPRTTGTDNQMSLRNLLMLGISGGIIPCPSALVVLLSAIALGRVGFGLVLILVFSIGLASVLTGIGLLLVYAGRLAAHVPTRGGIIQVLPIVSALIITVVGVGITVQALAQTGLLSL